MQPVSDDVNAHALQTSVSLGSGNTVESCIAACSNAGYTVAGVEYGDECCTSDGFRTRQIYADCNIRLWRQFGEWIYARGQHRLAVQHALLRQRQ